ncbi:type VI secretion system protein TssA [Arenibaculum sp.]|jgi:type VI secretion system ImpA family protein|uniref:type VI secretion system protein TssA n=1 Tax=Arenibaculum sp. TaxID=2865862 RepID=UPI002E0D1861|nr:type VI secretion system protein TssA [Arenibaculum sp.]
MAATIALDPARLLEPIPGTNPAGEFLRYGTEYDAVKEARREDDPSLPQGVWKTNPKRADWDAVIALCKDILEKRSKDMQVATWLLEGLVWRYGFAGLQPGIEVIAGLCRNFWDDLHPPVEDDDVSSRIGPLEWLNAKLPAVLQQIPLTRSGMHQTDAYSWTQYRIAQRLSPVTTRDPKAAALAEANHQVLLPAFEASARATPVEFHRELRMQVAAGLASLDGLSRMLDESCGAAAPSLATVRHTLIDILGWIDTVLRDKGEEPTMVMELPEDEDLPDDTVPETQDDDLVDVVLAGRPGPIRSREEAYYRLAEAAEYLFRTEPHSPVPYLIQRAVSWGSMPLHELLVELSRGRNDLSGVFDMLGFGPPENAQKSGR